MINPSIFKAYDIRGIYQKDFNDQDFFLIIKAIITFFIRRLNKRKLVLAIGRDVRLSTPNLFAMAKKAVTEMGVTGVDIGLTSTPTFYYGSLNYGYDGGFMITASHNPKEYNGVKFVIREGSKIIKIGKNTGIEEVKEITLNNKFTQSAGGGKIIKNNQVLDDEVNQALKHLENIKLKKFKIVTDTANGMAITYINKLFEKIPAQLIRLNDRLDGTFPAHEANPLKFETLVDLQKAVIKNKADFGIAPDGDGDRVFFIDENGQVIPATMTTCLIAEEILRNNHQETIVVDIRYIKNVINLVKKLGGKTALTKVGHAFISQKLTEVNGIFAGESSGHYFFRETGYAESSVLVIVYLLKVLSAANKPLSKVIAQYQTAYESTEFNFSLPKNLSGTDLQKKIAKDYSNGKQSWLDGLSVDYDHWRFNIRSSNTEPLIRLNVESDNNQLTQEKLKELKSKIIHLGAKIK